MNIWGTGLDQQIFHYFILIMIVICVPIMLFPKPIILYCRTKFKAENGDNIQKFKPFLEEAGVLYIL